MSDYGGHNLVFVVGSPRSGTGWLQQLLARHPLVRSGRQSSIFDGYVGSQLRAWRRGLEPAASRRLAGLAGYLTEREFLAALRDYMQRLLAPILSELAPGVLFAEGTPSHALFLSEIRELLPEARIIHLLRDGREVVAAMLAAARVSRADSAAEAGRAARVWIEHVTAVREAAPSLPGQVFAEVRFEDLEASPAAVLRRLGNFLKLPWSQADIDDAVAAANAEPTRKGYDFALRGELAARMGPLALHTEAPLRGAAMADWRRALSIREKLELWRIARPLLDATGYRWSVPW